MPNTGGYENISGCELEDIPDRGVALSSKTRASLYPPNGLSGPLRASQRLSWPLRLPFLDKKSHSLGETGYDIPSEPTLSELRASGAEVTSEGPQGPKRLEDGEAVDNASPQGTHPPRIRGVSSYLRFSSKIKKFSMN